MATENSLQILGYKIQLLMYSFKSHQRKYDEGPDILGESPTPTLSPYPHLWVVYGFELSHGKTRFSISFHFHFSEMMTSQVDPNNRCVDGTETRIKKFRSFSGPRPKIGSDFFCSAFADKKKSSRRRPDFCPNANDTSARKPSG